MNELKIDLPIARAPFKGVARELESQCRKAIHQFEMIDEDTSIAVALSGGKDSLALLYLLSAINGYGVPKFNLIAINVAGEFTCGSGVNTQFLQAICKDLGVPFYIRESTQKLETLECYRCSRERRRLLFEAAKEGGANTIAFGHHRDDNAQTLLMNLFHKGEFAGNLPKLYMHDYDITIIRPLILSSEEDLRAMALHYGYNRITCQCPVGQHSMRRKVDELINEIEVFFPHVRKNLSTASLLYGSDKAKYK